MLALQFPYIFLCYFVGAIPFGVIIAQGIYKVNIRELGSRNTGATNVWRVIGPKAGSTTLALDFLKGFLPVLLARLFFHGYLGTAVYSGLAAIIGHNWSIFLKGSGGKGVATSAGVFFALMPIHMSISLAIFLGFFFYTKQVSVGSIAAAITLFLVSFILKTPFLLRFVV
jgi:glycerol-3-phosphate acyltransferase PlsY